MKFANGFPRWFFVRKIPPPTLYFIVARLRVKPESQHLGDRFIVRVIVRNCFQELLSDVKLRVAVELQSGIVYFHLFSIH